MADIAPKLVGLSAEKLTALHKRVHDQYLSSATIEVHHTILNEMGVMYYIVTGKHCTYRDWETGGIVTGKQPMYRD